MSSRLLLFALACVNAARCSVGTALLDNLSQRLLPHSSPAGEAPNTVVTSGRIVGDWALDTVDGRVARFLGIPFAASTEGPHRWRPPEPAASWAPATLNATHWGPACAQGQPSSDPDVPADQSEDCLTVNVFTPALGRPRGSPPLPVLLFFHGGAFVAGSSHGPWDLYDGTHVAHRGSCVVVSANYRLDAFGWLVTSKEATGNFGLLDQQLALSWVRDNIAAFGGDSERVTLWGESAGGMSGLVHMTSPASAGLFHRVIQQSNPAGFAYLSPQHAAVYGDALVSKAGCGRPPKGTTQLDCLRNVSASVIMNASLAVASSYYDVARGSGWNILDGVLQWGPVVDGGVLPLQPMAALVTGNLSKPAVDVLVGHNTDEVATFLDGSYYAGLFPGLVFDTILLSLFGIRGASAVREHYASLGLPAGVDQLDIIMTDYWFRCAKEAIGVAVNQAGGRAWSYRFNWNASFGSELYPRFGLTQCVAKVCHGSELSFVFGNTGLWAFTREEQVFSDSLMSAWTNFAHTGDPNLAPEGHAHIEGSGEHAFTARRLLQPRGLEPTDGDAVLPPWPQLTNDTRLTLVLEPGSQVESTLQLCQWWDTFGYAHAK